MPFGLPTIPTKQQIEDYALPYFLTAGVFLGGVLSFVEFIPLPEFLSIAVLASLTNYLVDSTNIEYTPILLACLTSFVAGLLLSLPAYVSVTLAALAPYIYLKYKIN